MPSLPGKQNPSYKHGFAKRGKRPAIYWRWQRMIKRCHLPKDKDYANYGARGITVCDRWRFGDGEQSGFQLWLLDMGSPPVANASVDRIDNQGPYTPDNCRWGVHITQANNRRNNRHITHNGVTLTIAQWARVVGIGPKTIRYRLERGASPEEALFKVPHHGRKIGTKP